MSAYLREFTQFQQELYNYSFNFSFGVASSYAYFPKDVAD